MDISVKLSIPDSIYRFYENASVHVANCTAEDIMADALSNYAMLLSNNQTSSAEKHRESI